MQQYSAADAAAGSSIYILYTGSDGARVTEGRRPQKPPSATAHYAFKTPSTTHSVVFRL